MSSVRATDPATGQVQRKAMSPGNVFGEGLAVRPDGSLVQITWKDGTAFVWDPASLTTTGRFRYGGEGWGLTTAGDGTLLMSDGSDRITERDPSDFTPRRRWTVRREGGAADELNELEWDGSHLWANRWQTDEIVRIDRRCQRVDAVVDASALVAEAGATGAAQGHQVDVLNGIAAVPGTDRFLVTGKLWPTTFEVRFVPA
ncbi:MAG: glutaminyl-peptide cyclotransferase, partial [Microthrixaceae bacterium]